MGDNAKRDARKERLLDELEKADGIIGMACKKAGVDSDTYYAWHKADEEFAKRADDIIEGQVDKVENKLLQKIKEGDITAIIFYLKTKGKKRGYSEKPLPPPEPEKTPAEIADEKKAKDALRKRIKAKKSYIIKLLKKEGKYTAELSYQAEVTAELMVRADLLQEDMMSPQYQQVIVEISREGNRREQINPKERLLTDLQRNIQQALKALGMNTDSKERKTDGDDLGDFMKDMQLD